MDPGTNPARSFRSSSDSNVALRLFRRARSLWRDLSLRDVELSRAKSFLAKKEPSMDLPLKNESGYPVKCRRDPCFAQKRTAMPRHPAGKKDLSVRRRFS